MDDVEKKLYRGYALELAKWQVELYQMRNQRDASALQRYFNSTPVRNAMARLMFVSAHDNQVYTKAKISRELIISRQAASKMVEECIASEWVEPDGKGYRATVFLINQLYNYTEDHINTVKKRPIRYWLNAMENYQIAMGKSVN
jgi:hypothetical protein